MKKLLAVLFLLTVCCGCISVESKEPPVFFADAFRLEGEGIVSAIITGNYRKFAQIVREPEISGNEEKFIRSRENMLKTYGRPNVFRFLINLRTPLLVNQIWVIDFIRKGSDGREFVQQQLFQLIFSDDNGRAKLMGMRFI